MSVPRCGSWRRCLVVLDGQATYGVGPLYPLSTGRTQLLFAGVNADRTAGFAAFATR